MVDSSRDKPADLEDQSLGLDSPIKAKSSQEDSKDEKNDVMDNETIIEESSMTDTSQSITSTESDSDSGTSESSTERKRMQISKLTNKDGKSVLSKSNPNVIDEEIKEESSHENSSEDSSDDSSEVDGEDLGLDKNYIMKELGCDSKKVMQDEDLLDQFIVLKAIIDKNLPKLLFKDISILQNIVSDVFPNVPKTELSSKNRVLEMID